MADKSIKKYSTSSSLLPQNFSAGEELSRLLSSSDLAVRHEFVAII
jgi:hypothetical protein